MPLYDNYGVPQGLEQKLGQLIAQRGSSLGTSGIGMGKRKGMGNAEKLQSLNDMLKTLFNIQREKMSYGKELALFGGLNRGFGGGGGGSF